MANKVDIKKLRCYYFDYIININDIDLDNNLLNKIYAKILQFMLFHIKHRMIQNLYILFLIK